MALQPYGMTAGGLNLSAEVARMANLVDATENLVETQNRLVQKIKARGGDITEAQALLEIFRDSLALHEHRLAVLARRRSDL